MTFFKDVTNSTPTFDELYEAVTAKFAGRTRLIQKELKLTPKPYPHHEGIYRYEDRYWIGLYQRDNEFEASFLEALCQLCIDTKIGRLYPNPFKTFIIRDIPKETIYRWEKLLGMWEIHSHYSSLGFSLFGRKTISEELLKFRKHKIAKA